MVPAPGCSAGAPAGASLRAGGAQASTWRSWPFPTGWPEVGPRAAWVGGGGGPHSSPHPRPFFSAVPAGLTPLNGNCHLQGFNGEPAVHSLGRGLHYPHRRMGLFGEVGGHSGRWPVSSWCGQCHKGPGAGAARTGVSCQGCTPSGPRRPGLTAPVPVPCLVSIVTVMLWGSAVRPGALQAVPCSPQGAPPPRPPAVGPGPDPVPNMGSLPWAGSALLSPRLLWPPGHSSCATSPRGRAPRPGRCGPRWELGASGPGSTGRRGSPRWGMGAGWVWTV